MKKFSLKIDFKAIPADKKKMMIKEAVLVLILIAADWLSKLAAFAFLKDKPDGVAVIDGFFYLFKATNDGVAFGMFEGYSRLFGVFSMFVCAGVLFYLLKNLNDGKYMRIGLLLVFAGGFANGVERLIFGYVRDFLFFPFYSNFNIADALVVVGAGLLIVYLLFFSSKDLKEKERLEADERARIAAEKDCKNEYNESDANTEKDCKNGYNESNANPENDYKNGRNENNANPEKNGGGHS
ncbi:MAG: signal peptidase II [Clostridiales bacterium]|jgi:signal peptidase II|nr:signal peptidase II [Clostridiales bacterium]